MSEVPVRELNQNTPAVLARVKRGEDIDITERGVVIARLVSGGENPLSDLIGAGSVVPASASGPIPYPGGPVVADSDAGKLLRDMRDEERS